jgi:hypothetical protein
MDDLHSDSRSHGEEIDVSGVSIDRDTQTVLKSPAPKRVKLSESKGESPSPSLPAEHVDENGEALSESGSDSEDSFILDLFHARGSEELNHGNTYRNCANLDDMKITKEECLTLKTELHNIGGSQFMRKYIQGGSRYTLEDVLYAFGYVVV